MGALTPDEEASLLYSKLSDPSITPSSDESFRSRMVSGFAPSTPPDESTFLGALQGSASRAAPWVQGVMPGGLASQAIGGLVGSGARGTGLLPTTRDPVSFERTTPPGEALPPAPMPDTTAPVAPAPTLAPDYGKSATTIGAGMGALGPSIGSGLSADFNAAQQARIRDLEARRELQGDLGMSQAGRVMAVSDIEQQEAARQAAAAEEQKKIDADANSRMQAYLDQNTKLANEISSMKTDPSRLMRSQNAGTQFAMAIGAVAGGMLSALNGGPNQFMEQINRSIDRDIQSQLQEIDNKKASLATRNTIFGQMLQQTGDARQAAKEYRSAMYQAAQTSLKARADALGIPEIRANSELASNAIQQERDKLDEDIKLRRLQMYQQQAAAAASARAAAARQAWERAMEVAKLGLEKDKLSIEASKVNGGQQDQLKSLAKELADPATIQSKVAVENAYQRLLDPKTGQIDSNRGLPGVGPWADAKVAVLGKRLGLNDEERVSRQDFEQLKLGYRNLITGSGGGEKELAEIQSAFEGAGTPPEQANAVKKLRDTVYRLEETKKAGYDPAVRAELERRLSATGANGMPSTVRIKR